MKSMIVLSALLGLAIASPSAVVVDDGLSGHGLGLGLGGWNGGWNAAPLAIGGHGIATSYSSKIAHPVSVGSIHGGLLSAPLVRSWGAPSVLSHGSVVRSYAAPTIVRSSVLSSGIGHGLVGPTVLSSGHGIVGPSVLSSGHGLVGPAVLSSGHGIVGPTVLSSGHGLGLGYGKGW